MENEDLILSLLKKDWFVYFPSTQLTDENDPQYRTILELAGNKPENIKIVRVYKDKIIVLIKKNQKKIRQLLNLNKSQAKKLVGVFSVEGDVVVADFSSKESFLKRIAELIETSFEKEKENNFIYR